MSPYIDLSGAARGKIGAALGPYVEAVAADLRDEIVLQMDPGPVRTGREYSVPGTGIIDSETGKTKRGTGETYTASAPGEPPAVRTGEYAGAWQSTPAVTQGDKVTATATNDRKTEDGEHYIGAILEYGTDDGKIEPRPHIRPATEIVARWWGGSVKDAP